MPINSLDAIGSKSIHLADAAVTTAVTRVCDQPLRGRACARRPALRLALTGKRAEEQTGEIRSQRSLQAGARRLSLTQIHLFKRGEMLEQKPGSSIRIAW
jgi:hypothetical protein